MDGLIREDNMVSRRANLYPPRLLRRPDAAAYCDLTPSTFDDWVRNGDLPGPLPNKRRWDRVALDLALNQLSGIESTSSVKSPFDQWKAGQDG